jgi:hypothetical protein
MPRFIEAYNTRFGKEPRERHDAHRAVRADEDLDLIFAWRELRKVTQNLTLHYERKLYLLPDSPGNRRLIGKYVEVFQFPDGRVEIRVAGESLPYSIWCRRERAGLAWGRVSRAMRGATVPRLEAVDHQPPRLPGRAAPSAPAVTHHAARRDRAASISPAPPD